MFGSQNCDICQKLTDNLDRNNISYVFVDALADGTQDFCDRHNVDALPHVQVIDANGKMLLNKSGYILPATIKKLICQC